MGGRYHEEPWGASVTYMSPLGSNAKPRRSIERARSDQGIAGCNRNLRSSGCAVEGNLHDLIVVSVADIEVGAGIIDPERLAGSLRWCYSEAQLGLYTVS